MRLGMLSDGTKVVARPGSKTGGATLEIKVSNSKIYKIRYQESLYGILERNI